MFWKHEIKILPSSVWNRRHQAFLAWRTEASADVEGRTARPIWPGMLVERSTGVESFQLEFDLDLTTFPSSHPSPSFSTTEAIVDLTAVDADDASSPRRKVARRPSTPGVANRFARIRVSLTHDRLGSQAWASAVKPDRRINPLRSLRR